jgi:MOSC domain-containing protein YiiM
MPFGGFGGNLTIAGAESTVCIGDRWQAGGVVFEVRSRGAVLENGRRWQIVDLPKQVIQNGRSGWYLRVLEGGELTAGMAIELRGRDQRGRFPRQVAHHEPDNVAAIEDLATCPNCRGGARLLERIARQRRDRPSGYFFPSRRWA